MSRRNLKVQIIQLLTQHHLLSAQEILKKLAAEQQYNKSSIYRSLDQLVDQGVLCQHNFSGTVTEYELREYHHLHLVCTQCGAITAADCTIALPETIDGFHINHHHVTLFGVCSACNAN